MQPEVLFRHGTNDGLDPGIHARRIGHDILSRKIRPGIANLHAVPLAARKHARDAGNDGGTCRLGKPRQSAYGRRLDSEKRDKNGVAPTKIQIWQIVEQPTGLHGLDGGSGTVLPRQHKCVAEPAATFKDDALEHFISLCSIDCDAIKAHDDSQGAHIETDEVWSQQNDRTSGLVKGAYLFFTDELDQS